MGNFTPDSLWAGIVEYLGTDTPDAVHMPLTVKETCLECEGLGCGWCTNGLVDMTNPNAMDVWFHDGRYVTVRPIETGVETLHFEYSRSDR
jgi:hypothetical protein